MNIEEYKMAMQNVYVNTDKIVFRFENTVDLQSKRGKKPRAFNFKKVIFACAMTVVLLSVLLNYKPLATRNVSNFTITVYASDLNKELILSDNPITLSTSSQFNIKAISNEGNENSTGSINFDLNFKCDGENIKDITYQLSNQTISRENKEKALAWFAENASYNTNYNSLYKDDKDVYRVYRNDTTHIYYVTKMIGNAYTVRYENQDDKNYALELNLFKDDNNNLTAKNFTITVTITLNDGTTLEKHILVRPLIAGTSDYEVDKLEVLLTQ
ncbi:MAG: hypothetical protein ACERKN_00305 [Velocimicrobium sp.]